MAVVVLAAVIFIGGALSKPPSPEVDFPSISKESLGLYERAAKQYESGETTLALETAERALAADPDNEDARRLIGRIKADGSSQPDDAPATPAANGDSGDGSEKPPPAAPDPFDAPIADISKLLPASLDGWARGSVTTEGSDAVVPFTPSGPDSAASRALFAVHDFSTPDKAKDFIPNVAKNAFPESGTTVDVDGVQAYFGTDGSLLATVSFVRGRYAFEVSVTSASGSPASLKSVAVAAARAFPDAVPK